MSNSADRREQFEACCRLYGNEWDMSDRYLSRAIARGWETFRFLPEGKGEAASLLDIGSAYGFFAAAYHECFGYGAVSLIDIGTESETLERKGTQGLYRCEQRSCNIERDPLPFADESFDTVVCMEVFEHLLFDPVFAMNEVNRVLKPGGCFLITVPNISSDSSLAHLVNGSQPSFYQKYVQGEVTSAEEALGLLYCRHCREYTGHDLQLLAEATGFAPERIGGFNVVRDSLQSWKFSLLKTFVHLLFPRSTRVREDFLVGVLRKEQFTPLDQLSNRYPAELFTAVRAED